jgi:hypothetical protein
MTGTARDGMPAEWGGDRTRPAGMGEPYRHGRLVPGTTVLTTPDRTAVHRRAAALCRHLDAGSCFHRPDNHHTARPHTRHVCSSESITILCGGGLGTRSVEVSSAIGVPPVMVRRASAQRIGLPSGLARRPRYSIRPLAYTSLPGDRMRPIGSVPRRSARSGCGERSTPPPARTQGGGVSGPRTGRLRPRRVLWS